MTVCIYVSYIGTQKDLQARWKKPGNWHTRMCGRELFSTPLNLKKNTGKTVNRVEPVIINIASDDED